MSDFLDHIVTRSLAPAANVQPRVLSLFEPPSLQNRQGMDIENESVEEPSAASRRNRNPPAESPAASPSELAERLRSLETLWSGQREEPVQNSFTAQRMRGALSPVSGTPLPPTTPEVPSPVLSVPTAIRPTLTRSVPPQPEHAASAKSSAIPSATVSSTRAVEPSGIEGDAVLPQPAHSKSRPASDELATVPNTRFALPSDAPAFRDEAKRVRPVMPSLTPVVAMPRNSVAATPHVGKERPSAPAPVIHVTIGRVEVRATVPPPERSRLPAPAAKVMSLDEYLQKRSAGGGR